MGGNFSCSSKEGRSWLLQRIDVAFSPVVWFKDINPSSSSLPGRNLQLSFLCQCAVCLSPPLCSGQSIWWGGLEKWSSPEEKHSVHMLIPDTTVLMLQQPFPSLYETGIPMAEPGGPCSSPFLAAIRDLICILLFLRQGDSTWQLRVGGGLSMPATALCLWDGDLWWLLHKREVSPSCSTNNLENMTSKWLQWTCKMLYKGKECSSLDCNFHLCSFLKKWCCKLFWENWKGGKKETSNRTWLFALANTATRCTSWTWALFWLSHCRPCLYWRARRQLLWVSHQIVADVRQEGLWSKEDVRWCTRGKERIGALCLWGGTSFIRWFLLEVLYVFEFIWYSLLTYPLSLLRSCFSSP